MTGGSSIGAVEVYESDQGMSANTHKCRRISGGELTRDAGVDEIDRGCPVFGVARPAVARWASEYHRKDTPRLT